MRLCFALIVTALAVPGATQARQTLPTFEAASVKPNPAQPPFPLRDFPAGVMPGAVNTLPGGRVEGRAVELRYLVYWAYGLESYQVVEGRQPELSKRFDITAKTANPAAIRDEIRLMLRALLQERFNLEAHIDGRDGNLMLMQPVREDGRPGPGLIPFTDDCEIRNRNRAPFDSPQWKAGPPCTWAPVNGRVHFGGFSMIDLGKRLATYLEMPILDRTNWPGQYELDMRVNLEQTPLLERLQASLTATLGPRTTPPSDSPALIDARARSARDQAGEITRADRNRRGRPRRSIDRELIAALQPKPEARSPEPRALGRVFIAVARSSSTPPSARWPPTPALQRGPDTTSGRRTAAPAAATPHRSPQAAHTPHRR